MANDLHPGDYVIALNALSKTAGVLGGAIAAVWTSWSVKRSKRIAVAGLLVGAVLGFFVGTITALFLHPASAGHVVVVKRGAASLSSTLTSATVASTSHSTKRPNTRREKVECPHFPLHKGLTYRAQTVISCHACV